MLMAFVTFTIIFILIRMLIGFIYQLVTWTDESIFWLELFITCMFELIYLIIDWSDESIY